MGLYIHSPIAKVIYHKSVIRVKGYNCTWSCGFHILLWNCGPFFWSLDLENPSSDRACRHEISARWRAALWFWTCNIQNLHEFCIRMYTPNSIGLSSYFIFPTCSKSSIDRLIGSPKHLESNPNHVQFAPYCPIFSRFQTTSPPFGFSKNSYSLTGRRLRSATTCAAEVSGDLGGPWGTLGTESRHGSWWCHVMPQLDS